MYCASSVSYTHLDVYKRQYQSSFSALFFGAVLCGRSWAGWLLSCSSTDFFFSRCAACLLYTSGYLAADETELRELTDSAIAKLRGMSDAEYAALDLFPVFETEDMDAE